MPKKLIIAEKPSVAAEIAQALGGFTKEGGVFERHDLIVAAARGHLVRISPPASGAATSWSLDSLPSLPTHFDLEVLPKADDDFRRLQRLMERGDVGAVVNACDAGREGELIFRLIFEKAGCRKPIERMWIQSMTAAAIVQAFDKLRPGQDFAALYASALSRTEADWLVGVNCTRGVTKLLELQTGVSELSNIGRVQTPTLAFPVRREREILAFQAAPFWEVHGTFGVIAGTYKGELATLGEDGTAKTIRYGAQEEAEAVAAACRSLGSGAVSDSITRKEIAAPRLYDLTSLQRVANTAHKLSAKRTLDVAQALYEKRVITYPRTDADALPEDYRATAGSTMKALAQTEWAGCAGQVVAQGWVESADKRVFDDRRVSDHFAIIPTGELAHGLQGDEMLVYRLIVSRFIAAFYPPAIHDEVVRLTTMGDHTFRTAGRVVVDSAWQDVDLAEAAKQGIVLPSVADQERAQAVDMVAHAGKTSPPKRYTEATLLSAMGGAAKQVEDDEQREAMRDLGLGRPATRAGIIESLLATEDSRGKPRQPYLVRDGNNLVPSPKAMSLVTYLEQQDMQCLVSPDLTGEWEWRLARMEAGEGARDEFMAGIRELTAGLVAKVKAQAQATAGRQIASHCVLCQSDSPVEVLGSTCRCTKCAARAPLEVARRRLTDEELKALFESGRTSVLDGFKSKADKPFKAALVLKADLSGVSFEFPPDVPVQSSLKCPDCAGALAMSPKTYHCAACGFKLWVEVAGRVLKEKEAETLISSGRTPVLKGFKSASTKKAFSAALLLEKGGRVKFEFSDK
ncbi:DNA topoisomerase [Achromobacter insuavis]|uniref:DNA topoisomerase n=1 Tax=Achromobacter insuavis TaxID=1287735 RepID=UPI001F145B89|nr:DNA topoisomerase [Achromobacter insuavis]